MHAGIPDQDVATGLSNHFGREAAYAFPNLFFELGASYAFHEAWSTAVNQSDPALAPHVQFRMLKHRYDLEALLFLKDWGPLTFNSLNQPDSAAVDLNDFWHKHNWFVAVAQLYEALEDPRELQRAWQWLKDQADAMPRAYSAHSQSYLTMRIEFNTDGYTMDPIFL